jgi:hypothetical protein
MTTARVWTNADRLFSWMLRHLSFVRPDFARLRSDEYPIRLWTVAVFLFGALPLVNKRGLGWLVIGDEFDTTDRRTHAGITHYNGLYDQSRYFDQYLTRYFQRKGWHVTQFSILRPLSELWIEKVLVEGYPQLQRLQVSCHAAHMEQETRDIDRLSHVFRPCGSCEKCTRIVGILTALGADPSCCGYSPPQIGRALHNLVARGATLEHEAPEHLALLLGNTGLLPGGQIGHVQARERPAIMQLRFDPQRSPIDHIPVELRRPLYAILLQHAAGAVTRVGHAWADFDVLHDPALAG